MSGRWTIPSPCCPLGNRPGSPGCPACPYRRMGPARICVACASKTLEAIAPRACPVCSQRIDDDSPCRNSLCRERNRRAERIDAIAYLSGTLQDKIHSYKYEGKTGWSLIFGRLLVGWLEAHVGDEPPDLIVANPTYVSPGQPGPGHIETIIRSAATADYDGRWAFDTGTSAAIIKTQATEKSAGRSFAEKRAAAAALRRVPTWLARRT